MIYKPSRRQFLQGSLALTGAAAALGPRRALAAQPGATLAADFIAPWGVSYSDTGELFVTDAGVYQVQVFDQNGSLIRRFGAPGSNAGCLNYPTGLHVTGDHVYVCDTNNGRIAVFGFDGAWRYTMGGLGIATAKLASPNGVWAGDHWIWVANTRGHVFQRYSWYNRQLDQAFGCFGDDSSPLSPGTVDYKLRLPTAVTMDSSEHVYVLDSKHARVLTLDQDGKLLWDSRPESSGQGLSRPQGMVCHQDFLYVADTGNNRILKLDLQGKVAGELGGITDPHGISIFGGRMAIAQLKEKTVRIVEAF